MDTGSRANASASKDANKLAACILDQLELIRGNGPEGHNLAQSFKINIEHSLSLIKVATSCIEDICTALCLFCLVAFVRTFESDELKTVNLQVPTLLSPWFLVSLKWPIWGDF